MNTLKVVREENNGYYLSDGGKEEAFLPPGIYTGDIRQGDELEVFVYKDTDNQLIASLIKPYVLLEEFAFLRVNEVSPEGAFMDWGLPGDLLVPAKYQRTAMRPGESYLVFLMEDEETGRLTGSCDTDNNVFYDDIDLTEGEEVNLLLTGFSDLGMNVIINNMYKGLLFHSDIHQKIKRGQRLKGYVKNIREDGKIDVLLRPQGYRKNINKDSETLMSVLRKNGGFVEITDKSSPREIKELFGMSKKAFKKALGNIFKKEWVDLYEDGIGLKKKHL